MFKEEIRRLRKNCVLDSLQMSYILAITSMVKFFLKRREIRLALDTVLSDLIGVDC